MEKSEKVEEKSEQEKEAKPVEIESQKEEKIDMNKTPEKSKEQILAERQAKKSAKQGRKSEGGEKKVETPVKETLPAAVPQKPVPVISESPQKPQETEKSKEQILAEREAKKLAKQAAKKKDGATPSGTPAATPVKPSAPAAKPSVTPAPKPASTPAPKQTPDSNLADKLENLQINDSGETPGKKILSKAERRAIQEAQRAAKAKALEEKKTSTKKVSETPAKKMLENQGNKLFETPAKVSTAIKPSTTHKVKLFKHLYNEKCDFNINVNPKIHPAVVKLGLQYASDSVVGSNARCYAFLNAMKIVSGFLLKYS